jgi:hypothetical protein
MSTKTPLLQIALFATLVLSASALSRTILNEMTDQTGNVIDVKINCQEAYRTNLASTELKPATLHYLDVYVLNKEKCEFC